MGLGHENEIINLRTERQKELYSVFTKRKGIKYVFKNLSHLLYYRSLKKSYSKFEHFINTNLNLTEEYNTQEELARANLKYDIYI